MLRLKEGQVLSVANSKFAKSINYNDEIDVSITYKKKFVFYIILKFKGISKAHWR